MPLSEEFAAEIAAAVTEIAATTPETQDAPDKPVEGADAGATEVSSETGATGGEIVNSGGSAETPEPESVGGGEETSQVATETVVPPVISDSALTVAVQHGIPIEDARLFPSEAALGRAVQAVRRSVEQLAPKIEPRVEVDPVSSVLELLNKKRDQFDGDTLEVLDAIVAAQKAQYDLQKSNEQKYEGYVTSSQEAQRAVAQQETEAWFDSQVAALGEDFKDVLGVGGTDALPPNSTARAKRDEIANQAGILYAGMKAVGAELPTRDELFKRATKIVLADEYAKVGEKKLADSLKKRGATHTNRPGGNHKSATGGDVYETTVEALRKQFPGLA